MKWQQYFNRDGRVACVVCDTSVEIGDPVVTRKRRSKVEERGSTCLYCLRCGDEKHVITKEQATMPEQEMIISL